MARSRGAQGVADLVLVVVDDEDDVEPIDRNHLIVQNKCDLGRPARGIRISAKTGAGLDDLRSAMMHALDIDFQRDRPEITNIRHIGLVEQAHAALIRAREAAVATGGGSMPEEFVLADLQEARAALEEVTGRRAPDDLLAHIFSRFCVGK